MGHHLEPVPKTNPAAVSAQWPRRAEDWEGAGGESCGVSGKGGGRTRLRWEVRGPRPEIRGQIEGGRLSLEARRRGRPDQVARRRRTGAWRTFGGVEGLRPTAGVGTGWDRSQ